jgi:predicted O-methyltransferase YrrM
VRSLRSRIEALRYARGWLGPHRAQARHAEKSMIFSLDDDPAGPSERLLDVGLAAVQAARDIDLSHLDARLDGPPYWASIWPGEHYRLLAALGHVLAPRTIVEIGTATGLSALALRAGAPEATVATFDLVDWRAYPGSVLRDADFADGRLIQHLDDLSTTAGVERHRELLRSTTLIFVDAAKDGEQEARFLELLGGVEYDDPPIVVFDDIRQWKMLAIWREISRPKLDLTSFGHWSGTGLVDLG